MNAPCSTILASAPKDIDFDQLQRHLLSHYYEIGERFGFDYPCPMHTRVYQLTQAQLELATKLVSDVAACWFRLLVGLQSSPQAISRGVLGADYFDLQHAVLSAPYPSDGLSFPFCHRIDAIWTGDKFVLLEINPDNVGGLEDLYDLSSIYVANGCARRKLTAVETLADTLKRLHPREAGCVVYTDAVCRVLAHRLTAILRHLGVPCRAIHINELPTKRANYGWVYRHFVYSDLFVHDCADPVVAPTLNAIEFVLRLAADKTVSVYNPLSDRLLFNKALLDPAVHGPYLTQGEREAIARWVLPTKVITAERAQELHENPAPDVVIKFTDSLGGDRIYLPGMDYSHEDLSTGRWVEQAYVVPELLQTEGGAQVYAVHGLFAIDGVFAGDFIRVATKQLVNVSGGMLPTF